MQLKFRKVVSALASAAMIGSTVALAAAASYPAPFVQNGAADVAVVYGSTAATTDLIAVADITASLSNKLAAQTATGGSSSGASGSGGDAVNLATSTRKVYYNDYLNAAKTSLTDSELPTVLADGTFIDLSGTQYDYSQSVKVGGVAQATFGTSGGDLNDPALIVQIGTNAGDLYNYTLSFNKNVNVSDATNVQGQKIKVLGVDYVIGASSTNTTLYLYGAGQSLTIAGGESQTVSVASKDHTVDLVTTSSTTAATIKFDGVSKDVTEGNSYAFAGDLNVYVKNVIHPAFAGDLRQIELIVGANTLLLANGATVKVGADQTAVKGTTATITASGPGQISGFTVNVGAAKSKEDHLAVGSSFMDPVFGGLKVQYAGVVPALDSTARGKIVVDTDNNQFAYVTFTGSRATAEKQITYVYDNNTATTAVTPLLAGGVVQTTTGAGVIHVLEGQNAQENDYIVVNQGDAGAILEVTDLSVDSATTGTVTFEDAITGEAQTVELRNTSAVYTKTVNFFGGQGYTIKANDAGTSVNITWSTVANTTTLFPRIKLKNGGWMAFLAETSVPNSTNVIFPDGQTSLATTGTLVTNTTANSVYNANGVTWGTKDDATANKVVIQNISGISTTGLCNFNSTFGPAILFIEPKKWNDGSYGDYVCVPLSTTGSTEIAIGTPVLNGTDSGFSTLTSDTYKSEAVDIYGTFATMESRTNENGVATLAYPESQMYIDLLFTATGATVTPGSSSGGTATELGSVSVADTEASTVSTKNLLVVGGSCVNKVAAELLGKTALTCGADWEAATGVGAGQFLIQTFARTGGKVATLVAGYNAGDTTTAVKYLTTQAVDTTVAKKYKGTSATSATVESVNATA